MVGWKRTSLWSCCQHWFFALKPWAESTFQKNPDKIEIPKDEDTQNTPSEDTQTTQEEFTIEKYKELNSLLTQTALEAKKSVVEVSAVHEMEIYLRKIGALIIKYRE